MADFKKYELILHWYDRLFRQIKCILFTVWECDG